MQLGMNANDLKLFSAIVVACFLGFPYWKSKAQDRIRRRQNRKKEVQ